MNKIDEELLDAVVRVEVIVSEDKSSRWFFITKRIWFKKLAIRFIKYRYSQVFNKNKIEKPLLTVVPQSHPPIKANLTPQNLNYVLFDHIQNLADWYRRRMIEHRVLEKRTIPFLMSVGLVKISEDGDITVRSAPIQPDLANISAFSIAAIFGGCVCWIMFIAQAGLVTIIQSAGIGLIIGTLISLLHDFSYSQEDILRRVQFIKNLDY